MDQIDVQALPALVRITYRVLAARSLIFLALIMSVGLFSAALVKGTWLALATAGTFAVSVFLPILFRCMRKEDASGSNT